jgi:predicted nucleotidyltransferase
MVRTKAHILNKLSENEQKLREYGVRRCGLFGSFVRNEQNGQSDVDLLVEFEPEEKTFDNFMHLAIFLEAILGRRVDLVTVESLSPHIGPYIMREVEYAPLSA